VFTLQSVSMGASRCHRGREISDTCGGEDTWGSDIRWINMERVPEGVARFHPGQEHKKDNVCERFHRN
jgi:hypothetical protein